MCQILCYFLVLGARVELAHPCGRWILSPLRLPVPPSEQYLDAPQSRAHAEHDPSVSI